MGKKIKNNISSLIMLFCYGMAGCTTVILCEDKLEQILITDSEMIIAIITPLILLAFSIISIFVNTIIHEAGHLIFGLISGYKFSSFRVANIMLIKENGIYKIKKYSLLGTIGQCLMIPPKPEGKEVPCILYNLGGIIVNLITATLSILICMFINVNSYVYIPLLIFGLIGYVFFITNGFPLKSEAMCNDGYNIVLLKKDKETRKNMIKQLEINALISNGIRLKDMEEELYKLPTLEEMNNEINTTITVYCFCRAMDEMDFYKAKDIGNYIIKNATGIAGIHKSMIETELLFSELVTDQDEEIIKKLFADTEKFLRATTSMPSSARTLYAYETMVNHNQKEAEKMMKCFEKCIKKYPYKGEVEGELELIKLIS